MINIFKLLLVMVSIVLPLVGMEEGPALARDLSTTALPSVGEEDDRELSMALIDNKLLAIECEKLRNQLKQKESEFENGKKK